MLAQAQHQRVNALGALRVQPGGGLVQKQQLGLQYQRTGQRGTLEHAAAELRRVLAAHRRIQPHGGQLLRSNGIDGGIVQRAVLTQRQANVLQHRQRTKQPAVLKQHTKPLAQGQGGGIGDVGQLHPQHPDAALAGLLQQNHLAQQRGFARAAAADDGKYLGPAHRQAHPAVDHVGAKPRDHLAHFQYRVGGCRSRPRCWGRRGRRRW